MKRFAWFPVLAVLLCFCACSAQAKKDDPLGQIKKSGKLVMGTSADFPPYEFHIQENGEDKIVGFDVAVAKEIAKDLGVELEIKDMSFDGLLAALDQGNIDISLAGFSPTEERRKTTDFSDVYYAGTQGVLIRAADKDKYTDIASLKDAMIGAQKGAIQVGIAKKQVKGMSDDKEDNPQVKEIAKLGDLVLALQNKTIEAIIVETAVAKSYASANPDLSVPEFTFVDDTGGSSVAVKKGNTALVEAVNKTIAKLKESGAIDSFVVEAAKQMDEAK